MSTVERSRPPRLRPAPPRPDGPRIGARAALALRHPGCAVAYAEGGLVRRRYADLLAAGRLPSVTPRPAQVPVAMWSFSSQRDLPEQVASIRSFLRHAGRPASWTVVSDGTHDAAGRDALLALDPCVAVRSWEDVVDPALPPVARRFATAHPLGKKLAVMASLTPDGPTLMVDSDVLFAAAAADIGADLDPADPRPAFQLDCFDVLDETMVADDLRGDPTNTGVVRLHAPLDWTSGFAALDRVLPADGPVQGAWLEQAVTHLVLRAHDAVPLDPTRYVIRIDDHLRYREVPLPGAVLRHYAGPTRYMFWCRVAHDAVRRGVRR